MLRDEDSRALFSPVMLVLEKLVFCDNLRFIMLQCFLWGDFFRYQQRKKATLHSHNFPSFWLTQAATRPHSHHGGLLEH